MFEAYHKVINTAVKSLPDTGGCDFIVKDKHFL